MGPRPRGYGYAPRFRGGRASVLHYDRVSRGQFYREPAYSLECVEGEFPEVRTFEEFRASRTGEPRKRGRTKNLLPSTVKVPAIRRWTNLSPACASVADHQAPIAPSQPCTAKLMIRPSARSNAATCRILRVCRNVMVSSPRRATKLPFVPRPGRPGGRRPPPR